MHLRKKSKNQKKFIYLQPFILLLRLYNKELKLSVSVVSISEVSLIQQVIRKDRLAQKQLFDQFASKMLSTCRQYMKDLHEAEDVMLCGFMKVYQNIEQYRNEGSFEGWIRRIMIRECISHLRAKKEMVFIEDAHQSLLQHEVVEMEDTDDYQKWIDRLPKGCRYVFVLSVIEGYKHHEIAQMLQISVGTSKSQLAYAKKLLKEQIER